MVKQHEFVFELGISKFIARWSSCYSRITEKVAIELEETLREIGWKVPSVCGMYNNNVYVHDSCSHYVLSLWQKVATCKYDEAVELILMD